jgi:hypothetical protein
MPATPRLEAITESTDAQIRLNSEIMYLMADISLAAPADHISFSETTTSFTVQFDGE